MVLLSRLARLVLIAALIALTAVSAGMVVGPQIASLKNVVHGKPKGDITLAELEIRSELYDKDGNRIFRFSTDGSNRELLTIDQMPDPIVQTVISIEDSAFLNHHGINLKATFRALVENVGAGGISQGGSTITQQLVKNRVLRTAEQTVERKIREAVLAWRLEDDLSKGEILEWYLNTVYFGSGAYGIQAAAEVYFGKPATELDWADSALLVALIPNPSRYDPFQFPENARRQRQIVLNRLVTLGVIEEEDARFYSRRPLPTERNRLVDVPPEDYFVAEVRRRFLDGEIPANKPQALLDFIGETRESRIDALFTGGLRIYTTYDRELQALALKGRDTALPEDDRGFTMSLVSVEPSTGAVRALVGGPGFEEVKFNLATQGDRQPGSSFKPIVLLTALEQGMVPNDTISGIGPCSFDNPGSVDPIYTVNNFGNSSGGVDTLLRQTTRSSNCAYVRLGQVVSIPSVIETANRLGLGLSLETDNHKSLPLGATEVRPLEMAVAYSAIANSGVKHDPFYITRIEDAQGNVLYEHFLEGERVLSTQTACLATEILEQNVIAGTGTNARIPDQPAAGKTGTTEKFSDAWFVGFTPYLSTAVWMGHPDGRTEMENVGGRNVTGGSYPAQAWGDFMSKYHEGLERVDFEQCEPTRAGKHIREDGSLSSESGNTCSAYPGYSPTDTTGDGKFDSCLQNPAAYGYQRCGAISDESGGLVSQFCSAGGLGGIFASQQCPPGFALVDTNFDGLPDNCLAVGGDRYNQHTSAVDNSPSNQIGASPGALCDSGYSPHDSDGDGKPDVCVPDSNQATTQLAISDRCPTDYPYGADTDGDGEVDSCYNTPNG